MKKYLNLNYFWCLVAIALVSFLLIFFNKHTPTGQIRTYYIAADEILWNYAPAGKDVITDQPFTSDQAKYAVHTDKTIGSSYYKSVYRQYTDQTFTKLVPVPADQKYLGFLGPTIHAEVGDTIKVYFKNNTKFPATVHPHGVFYNKNSEGADYNDGTIGNDKTDDAVLPGKQYLYTWQVPERAGPGPTDPSSIMWMYHSHVDEVKDTISGLVGTIIITKKGMARPDGTPKDVDREFVMLYSIFDENNSWYLDKNTKATLPSPSPINKDDSAFMESNLKHSINGYIYGNMPLITMTQGSNVRWYVTSMGNEIDMHTPHWHGNTVTINGMRTDVAQLLPMGMISADMQPDNPGIWLFHCHVNDHLLAGMLTRYQVLPNKN